MSEKLYIQCDVCNRCGCDICNHEGFVESGLYTGQVDTLMAKISNYERYIAFIKSCIASGEVPDTFERFEAHLNSTK